MWFAETLIWLKKSKSHFQRGLSHHKVIRASQYIWDSDYWKCNFPWKWTVDHKFQHRRFLLWLLGEINTFPPVLPLHLHRGQKKLQQQYPTSAKKGWGGTYGDICLAATSETVLLGQSYASRKWATSHMCMKLLKHKLLTRKNTIHLLSLHAKLKKNNNKEEHLHNAETFLIQWANREWEASVHIGWIGLQFSFILLEPCNKDLLHQA